MASPAGSGANEEATFTVTMLSVLRGPFEEWLESRGLEIAHIPDTAPNVFIVVPTEFQFQRHPRDELA